MEPTGVKRKLAAILALDVEGYARLMRADEEATLETLGEYREIGVNISTHSRFWRDVS